ncbi:MAG: GNAT family N-acetyltransferase [Rhodobacteraceae bacterium]|nr:GNAT family N-acetyltransferase [Paracoccaceae bacterium]
MSSILIRPIEIDDEPQWRILWDGYLVFYNQPLAEEVTAGLFERLLGEGNHNGLVAEHEGNLIGFVHYLFHASTWSLADVCYLEDLFVSETARAGGVGRKLIEGVYDASDAHGCRNTYWHTHHHNERARKLYDRIGVLTEFVRYDRT